MNMRRTLAFIVALVVAAAAGAVFAMSRGGSDASASAAPQQPQQQRRRGADFQRFEQCLRSHGVTLTPGQRPDFGDATMEKAFAACRSYLPARPGRGEDDRGFGPPDDVPPDGTT